MQLGDYDRIPGVCHNCNTGDPDHIWNLMYCPDGKNAKEKKWVDHLHSLHIPQVEFPCYEIVYQEGPPKYDENGVHIPFFTVVYSDGQFIIKNVTNP